VLRAELAPEELVGVARLRTFGDLLYEDRDAAAVLHHGEPMKVEKRDDDFILSLELPFADHDDLELGRVEDELLARVGPYRRGIVLPDSLKRRSVDAAKMVGDRLEVTFVTEEGSQHMSQGQP